MGKTVVMLLFGQLEDTIFDICFSQSTRVKIMLCHISSAQHGYEITPLSIANSLLDFVYL